MRIAKLAALGCAVFLGGCAREGPPRPRVKFAVPAGVDGNALTLAAREWGVVSGASPEISELPYATLRERVQQDVERRGGAYDVVMIDDAWFPRLIRGGNLAALPWVPEDDFIPACLAVSRQPYATGTFYAAPYAGNTQMLFYRRDLFLEYGLAPPRTWKEVLAAAKKIGPGEKISGFVAGASAADFMPLLWAFGGEVFDEQGRPAMARKEGVEALRFMLELGKLSPAGYPAFESAQVAEQFLAGKAAMSLQAAAWIPAAEEVSQSKVVGKAEYVPTPPAKNKGAGLLSAWLLAAPSGSKNQALALEFIRWATETVQMKQAASRGNPPAQYTVFGDISLRARYGSYPAQLEALERARPRPRTPKWDEIEQALGAAIREAHEAKLPPEEALRRAAGEINAILEAEKTK